ncbi:MAG: hypothetical protein AAB731_00090 [Patescibacteria group bacterium]
MKKKHRKKIKKSPSRGSLIACAFCRGRGVDPFGILSKLSQCQACKGKKENFILEPHEECAACLGTGVFKHHRLPCAVCSGRGMLHRIPGKDRTDGCRPENKEMLDIETGLPCISAYDLGSISAKGGSARPVAGGKKGRIK